MNASKALVAMPTLLALAILVKRLGGEVTITQADIDDVAYSRLIESQQEDGTLILKTDRGHSIN